MATIHAAHPMPREIEELIDVYKIICYGLIALNRLNGHYIMTQ